MNKPEFLYHGSKYRFDIVMPQQACGACEQESLNAIYAADSIGKVIPFALPIRWYPDNPSGKRDFECNDGITKLLYGSLNPDGVGYIYKVKADNFEKIDDWQWVSKEACEPVEVLEIKVKDYLHTVEFSKEAEEINQELYGYRNRYECKIASLEEMNLKWDYEIAHAGGDKGNWITWKKSSIEHMQEGKSLPYYGILDGKIICEATAVLDGSITQNSDGLVDERTAYLSAFRTMEGYRGKGYFSKLFWWMLSDLKNRGYEKVTLGVEPEEAENKQMYAHYGFTEHIKNGVEIYPDGTQIDVEYYGKQL